MISRVLATIILASLLLAPATAFAYESKICEDKECTIDEVGPFMQGITKACGNAGNCELTDITTVFANVGNYVVGIIGAIVLLMYVLGGVYMMTSGGKQERVAKGKKFITISTTGLLIVMFSYLGIFALRGTLQYGAVAITDEGYVVCTGPQNEGELCGLNEKCDAYGGCKTLCELDKGGPTTSQISTIYGEETITKVWQCHDKTIEDFDGGYVPDVSGCISNLCPGGKNIKCCEIHLY